MNMNAIYGNKYLYSWYGKLRGLYHYYMPPTVNLSINEIIPNVYVGDANTAFQLGTLKELGITHIITAVLGMDAAYPSDFNYLKIDAIDIDNENLLEQFEKSNNFIQHAIENGGKIYIHCVCGVSRSVTLMAAYLIYKEMKTPQAAIQQIREKRECANPNDGFIKQLEKYYGKLYHNNNNGGTS